MKSLLIVIHIPVDCFLLKKSDTKTSASTDAYSLVVVFKFCPLLFSVMLVDKKKVLIDILSCHLIIA
jgi:hypothetical protein